MDISIVLAQIWGIGCIVFGLSMLLNKKWIAVAVEEITQNQGVMLLAGLVALILGLVLVALNNIWTSGLPLFITILGWLTLIKGAIILLFPTFTVSYYKKMNKGNIFVWGGVVVLILGLVLFFY
jgi:drug/metabolite transporter (DMT)-like permease